MSNFYVSLSKADMAAQIAGLLNQHNKLFVSHNTHTILNKSADYFVEVDGGRVVGCAGLSKTEPNLSLIQHICVNPFHRNKGVAKKLVNLAIVNCDTDFLYMTIRDDNMPSLHLAMVLGFVFVKQYVSRDHSVITMGRKKDVEHSVF